MKFIKNLAREIHSKLAKIIIERETRMRERIMKVLHYIDGRMNNTPNIYHNG